MDWLFPALLAPAVLTITIFTDKYIVGNAVKDYRGVVLMQSVMGFLVGTLFWVVTGFPILSAMDALIVITTGAINTWAAAIYFKVLREEDASYVIFMLQITPIFVIILSFIFLRETIAARQLLGFIIILLSSLFLSVENWQKLLHIPKIFWLLVLLDAMFASAAVIIKFAIKATSFAQILSYESWGIGLGGVVLYLFFPFIRKAFNEIIRTVRKRILGIMFLNEGIYVLSKSLSYFAYSIGPVALVSVVGSTQVFFGILFGWIFTLLYPHIFNEKIGKNDLMRKAVLAIFLILGIVLIY